MFWLGIVVSLCYVPGITGAYIATQWPALSVLLPLALWRSGPVTRFHWAGLLFIGYAALRLPYSPIPQDGVYGFWLVCIMGLSMWLGSTLNDLRGLYAGLALGASVSSVLAIFQHFGYVDIPQVSARPAGLYVNQVAQGLVLAVVAVALISERMWLWVPLLLPGLVLAGSRGAWLAFAVGVLSVHVRRVWVLAPLAAAGSFYVAALYLNNLATIPEWLIHPSDVSRLSIWAVSVHNLTWLGWGPGSFFSWLLQDGSGNTLYPEYAHNDAIQLIFEYGFAAAAPIGIFAFALARPSAREWPVIVAFVVAGCYSMALWVPVVSFLACVAAGRVIRSWAVDGRVSGSRGFTFVPWRRRASYAGQQTVSVVARA